MGSCGAKTAHQEVVQPQNDRQMRIQQQYSQFMRIDHPLNVNHKYTAFFKIIPDSYDGEGIRRTNKYQSRICKQEWIDKRQEFWETRIEGRQECWMAIKMACEADEENALAILAGAELKLVNKSLQILYDAQGMKYDIPVFCINEPVAFAEKPSTEAGITKDFALTDLKLKIRSQRFPHDLETNVQTSTKVSDLKQEIDQKFREQQVGKIRLFFNGREMQDHHQLGNYNLLNNTVLQAFCQGKEG